MLVAGIVVAVIGVALIFLSGEARADVARALRLLGWVAVFVGVVLMLVWLVRELGLDDESTALLVPAPLAHVLGRLTRGRLVEVVVLYVDGRQIARHVAVRRGPR